MRGIIPRERMDQIHRSLSPSMDMASEMLAVVGAFAGGDPDTHDAQLQILTAWNFLNESHLALTEAEACRIWHSEFREPPDTKAATYFCRYFLDDAVLRLYAGVEPVARTFDSEVRGLCAA